MAQSQDSEVQSANSPTVQLKAGGEILQLEFWGMPVYKELYWPAIQLPADNEQPSATIRGLPFGFQVDFPMFRNWLKLCETFHESRCKSQGV
jgi:hypothetical protein